MNPRVIIGGIVGAVIGSSVGIAALGTAISGTLPLALLGAAAGWIWPHVSRPVLNQLRRPVFNQPQQAQPGHITRVSMTGRSWLVDREEDCEENAYACSMRIRVQLVQASTPSAQIFHTKNLWAIGYIFGFADGWMQRIQIEANSNEGMLFLFLYYKQIRSSGNPRAEAALRFSVDCQGDSVFMQGMTAGGSDAFAFMQEGKTPNLLESHLRFRR